MQSIGHYAFHSCSSIVDLDLPAGLQSLDEGVFADYPGIGLETVVRAFWRRLVLPASLASIGDGDSDGDSDDDGSFDGCTCLARVLAPDALVKGDMVDPAKVFSGCPARPGPAGWRPCRRSSCRGAASSTRPCTRGAMRRTGRAS